MLSLSKHIELIIFIFTNFYAGSDSIKSITISNEDAKPRLKKSTWTQKPESPEAQFEENDPMNNDNDQNYSAVSNEIEM